MIKLENGPKFDSLMAGEIHINRMGVGDKIDVVIVYAHSGSGQTFGSVKLDQLSLTSPQVNEALSALVEAIEQRAAKLLFDQEPSETQKEGIHVREPQGIADEEEVDCQL